MRRLAAFLPIGLGLALLGAYLMIVRPGDSAAREWAARLTAAPDSERSELCLNLSRTPELARQVAERLLAGAPDVRSLAVELLFQAGDVPALDRLVELLDDAQLRSEAARQLAEANYTEARGPIEAALRRSEPGAMFRLTAFRALREMGAAEERRRAALAVLMDPRSQTLASGRNDAGGPNAERTLRLLAIELCHQDEPETARRRAWEQEALFAFQAENAAVRAASLHCLSRIRHPRALRAILEGMKDQSFIIRPSAAEALEYLTPLRMRVELWRIASLPSGRQPAAYRDFARRLAGPDGILRP